MAKCTVVAAKQQIEATKLDWSLLDCHVRELDGGSHAPTKFSLYALRLVLRLSSDEASEAITDASQDRGVDAVVISDATKEIHLFQFKYHETADHVSRQFPARSVDLAISFVTDLLERRQSLLDTTNRALQNKILEIWDGIAKGPMKVHLHFVSNGRRLEPVHGHRLVESLARFDVEFHEYGAAEILRLAHSRSPDKSRRKLTFFRPAQEIRVREKRMLVGLVHLSELARLVARVDRPDEIDNEIFADNVRGILGQKNDVNKSMLRTIAKSTGAEFVFRNNGVTIVADQILCQAGGNFPVEMVSPQIVNGCQTASTAFLAARKNAAMLERDEGQSVLVKIIESRDPHFNEDIALSTNSQTRIFGRDLRAIDETQLKIERLLRRHGFAYLRKRTDTTDLPRCQTIDMARLGQLILAYYRHLPEQAKTRTNEIFGEMYDDVFDVQLLDAQKIITAHTLNFMLDERRQAAKQRLRTADATSYDEEWILEGGYHVLFVVSLLCERDDISPAELKFAVSRLNEAVAIVGDFVKSHSTVAAYRLFRTVGTGDALARIVTGTPRQRKLQRDQLELF